MNRKLDVIERMEIIAEIQARSILNWEYLHGLTDEQLLNELRRYS